VEVQTIASEQNGIKAAITYSAHEDRSHNTETRAGRAKFQRQWARQAGPVTRAREQNYEGPSWKLDRPSGKITHGVGREQDRDWRAHRAEMWPATKKTRWDFHRSAALRTGRKIPAREADLERGLVKGNRELPGTCAARSKDRKTSGKNSDRTEVGGSEENQGKSFERETQRAAAT
jgi:hypothetical protein